MQNVAGRFPAVSAPRSLLRENDPDGTFLPAAHLILLRARTLKNRGDKSPLLLAGTIHLPSHSSASPDPRATAAGTWTNPRWVQTVSDSGKSRRTPANTLSSPFLQVPNARRGAPPSSVQSQSRVVPAELPGTFLSSHHSR